MGSLESGVALKRDPLLLLRSSSTSRAERQPFLLRVRSRCSRFLFRKFDYLQWICAVAVFLCFVIFAQMYLPGSSTEKKSGLSLKETRRDFGDLKILKQLEMFEFGQDFRFEPTNLLQKFRKDTALNSNFSSSNRTLHSFGLRKPRLALVFPDQLVDSQQVLMVTIAAALQEIGYEIQVYSLEQDGPMRAVWGKRGIPVTHFPTCDKKNGTVDWLNFDGILLNSIEVKDTFSCFLQEPFQSLPLIWTIHERALAIRSRQYTVLEKFNILNYWKRVFNRSTVVVFPNYLLPMLYSSFDTENFFVIPGSPAQAWEADIMVLKRSNLRFNMGYTDEDMVITIVGSDFLYSGMWVEHACVLKALLPLLSKFPLYGKNPVSHLKILVLCGDSSGNYSDVIKAISKRLKYPRDVVKHVSVDVDAEGTLTMADLVIYGSFHEEQSFPEVLVKAMCLGKPIFAPDLSVIGNYVDNRVNGYLFPKDNIGILSEIISQVISKGKLSPLARNIASIGRSTAKNLMVSETIEGYASLLEHILKLPSEVEPPKLAIKISPMIKEKWRWDLFEDMSKFSYLNRTFRSCMYLDKLEVQWNETRKERPGPNVASNDTLLYSLWEAGLNDASNDTLLYSLWEEERNFGMFNIQKRIEEEEMKDRMDQVHGTWDEVYRNARRADRVKNDLHESEEGELQRTGQPLCIYEPYYGEGIWPFLHNTSLYRGIGLSTKGRRPGSDDVDASSRLPILNNPYYRDVLGEFGAIFGIANRIDRLHKNAWIGFQSWRATARKVSLSTVSETALLKAVESRRHGDALYFWVRMDEDPRNPSHMDFWSFCDALNAGNCKFAFSAALKRMYGINHISDLILPPMPVDGGTWSAMQSWVLPTRSFLEFVMFSRMFVDSLDADMYDEHHSTGHCCLSLSKDKHCYSRLLELVINVWAHHSARRMVYVDPTTGKMQEQHQFDHRRGQMWIGWFLYATLKSMDEDNAEEYDLEGGPMLATAATRRRWLWPSTGEVFWIGAYEREKSLRLREKESRKQKSREKQNRMRRRKRQKVIGKYIKPPLEIEEDYSNSTSTTTSIDSGESSEEIQLTEIEHE